MTAANSSAPKRISTGPSGLRELLAEAGAVEAGDAAPACAGARPDRNQGADQRDQAADPHPADQRIDDHPECGRWRIVEVALRGLDDRLPLSELGGGSGLALGGRVAD